MTKIKCLNFVGSDCRTYTTPKGNTYEFYKEKYIEISDPEDALHFLNAANGTAFTSEGAIDKVRKTLEKAAKAFKKKAEVDEDNPPEETGALEPTDEDLAAVDGDAPVDGPVDSEVQPEAPGQPEEKPGEEKSEPEGQPEEGQPEAVGGTEENFTEAGLKDLNKKQQDFLIKKVQGEDAEIPRYEKDRVKLLIKLQDEGANLTKLIEEYKA